MSQQQAWERILNSTRSRFEVCGFQEAREIIEALTVLHGPSDFINQMEKDLR